MNNKQKIGSLISGLFLSFGTVKASSNFTMPRINTGSTHSGVQRNVGMLPVFFMPILNAFNTNTYTPKVLFSETDNKDTRKAYLRNLENKGKHKKQISKRNKAKIRANGFCESIKDVDSDESNSSKQSIYDLLSDTHSSKKNKAGQKVLMEVLLAELPWAKVSPRPYTKKSDYRTTVKGKRKFLGQKIKAFSERIKGISQDQFEQEFYWFFNDIQSDKGFFKNGSSRSKAKDRPWRDVLSEKEIHELDFLDHIPDEDTCDDESDDDLDWDSDSSEYSEVSDFSTNSELSLDVSEAEIKRILSDIEGDNIDKMITLADEVIDQYNNRSGYLNYRSLNSNDSESEDSYESSTSSFCSSIEHASSQDSYEEEYVLVDMGQEISDTDQIFSLLEFMRSSVEINIDSGKKIAQTIKKVCLEKIKSYEEEYEQKIIFEDSAADLEGQLMSSIYKKRKKTFN